MDITVVIPTYNRYTLLYRALSSLYAQTYPPKEIIVVDDGSTDETSQIQKDFPNIIYIYQENRGVSSARNVGIKKTSSEWIAFLDSDDEWHKEKLQTQVEFHQKNTNIMMSYTGEVWIRNGVHVKIPKKYRKIGKDVFLENLSYCNIAPSSVLINTKIFNEIGLFDETLQVCEDYDMWLRIAIKYQIALIDEKLINKYAGHDQQLGFTKNLELFRMQSLKKIITLCKDKEKKKFLEEELDAKLFNKMKVKKR